MCWLAHMRYYMHMKSRTNVYRQPDNKIQSTPLPDCITKISVTIRYEVIFMNLTLIWPLTLKRSPRWLLVRWNHIIFLNVFTVSAYMPSGKKYQNTQFYAEISTIMNKKIKKCHACVKCDSYTSTHVVLDSGILNYLGVTFKKSDENVKLDQQVFLIEHWCGK